MPSVVVYNQLGTEVGQLELSDSVYAFEPNMQAVYDVVKAQRAGMRQGTHKTKTRAEVRGGGRKPWRQKEQDALVTDQFVHHNGLVVE